MVAPEERGAPAPAATPGDASRRLHGEVRAVLDELGVHAHDLERRRHACLVQIRPDQLADGEVHQRPELGEISQLGETMGEARPVPHA
jgi:hypothetical protein